MRANPTTVLAADIGGTNARLALFEPGGRELLCAETYPTAGSQSAAAIVREFLSAHPARPAAACLAVAGPVHNGHSAPVNIRWAIDAGTLAETLSIPALRVVNDLEANARGTELLHPSDLVVVSHGQADLRGNRIVVSAGTGLGEAALVWNGAEYVAVASEGGHSDFAPTSELQVALYRYLAANFGHVSYERVCSGAGLVNIYRFLRDAERGYPRRPNGQQPDLPTPAAITARASAEPDSPAARALDMFASIYGARAASVALSFMATGGVFLGGGIAPRIVQTLTNGSFRRAFVDKGRLSAFLERVPVHVILNDRTALFGAARIAADMIVGEPTRAVRRAS
jgi:glucokinase